MSASSAKSSSNSVPGGSFQAVEVGERDPQVLRLPAAVGPHRHVAVRAAREARVDGEAEPGLARKAVLAEPARHVERENHPVAFADARHPGADLFDDPHVLVTEHHAGGGAGAPLVHVQVGAADRGRGHADDHVVGILDPRIGHLFHCDSERLLVHDRFHSSSSRRCRLGAGYPRSLPPMPRSRGLPGRLRSGVRGRVRAALVEAERRILVGHQRGVGDDLQRPAGSTSRKLKMPRGYPPVNSSASAAIRTSSHQAGHEPALHHPLAALRHGGGAVTNQSMPPDFRNPPEENAETTRQWIASSHHLTRTSSDSCWG